MTGLDQRLTAPEEHKVLSQSHGVQNVGMPRVYQIGHTENGHNTKSNKGQFVDVEPWFRDPTEHKQHGDEEQNEIVDS
jgi:hypothetical protein